MKCIHVLRAAVAFIGIEVCLFADEALSQPQLKSGIYESLMLAVDTHGAVTGYYREDQGSGVTKTCSFFLSGHEKGGQADVVTWNIEAFRGSLKAADQAVVLRIEKGRDHPGCGSVLPPLISDGMSFDRISTADWTSLRRVTKKKAFIFRKPDGREKRGTYVVAGDIVGVLSKRGDWLMVEYPNDGKRVKGWMRAADAAQLHPPP
jgi:hypothetical protein